MAVGRSSCRPFGRRVVLLKMPMARSFVSRHLWRDWIGGPRNPFNYPRQGAGNNELWCFFLYDACLRAR